MHLWALIAVKFHLLSPLPSGARFRHSHKHNGKGYFWRMVGRLTMSMLRAGDLFLYLTVTLWSPPYDLEPLSGSYWEVNRSSEIQQELETTKPQSAIQGESLQRIFNLKLSWFIQETGVGPRPSAEQNIRRIFSEGDSQQLQGLWNSQVWASSAFKGTKMDGVQMG